MTIIDKIAWIRLEDGAILSSRSRGKDVYYLPGGKREPGESDVDTLVREIREELSVAIVPDSTVNADDLYAYWSSGLVGVDVGARLSNKNVFTGLSTAMLPAKSIARVTM